MKIKKKTLLSPKTFNYLYSIGASIVILGALFKLLHVTGADIMLILGMGTEAVIFFISAFDEPAREPNWENVYPGIYNKTLTVEEKMAIADRRAK
ncbi:MAG: gliding motility protein GldL [Bacteroidales bacterium]|nr:gliding motility protein GldL [Bacteroidales bacterium]